MNGFQTAIFLTFVSYLVMKHAIKMNRIYFLLKFYSMIVYARSQSLAKYVKILRNTIAQNMGFQALLVEA